jgi:hypothetical protein
MSITAPAGPRLSDAEMQEVLALTRDADSVELKLTVPDPDRRATVRSLGIDVLDAQIRQVFFFDTPDLVCNAHGVVVRARRVQGRGDDSVIKLRPVIPAELPAELRRSRNLVVEVDALPGGFVCSASLKHSSPTGDVRQVGVDGGETKTLFSKEQRVFFRDHAPSGIKINDLTALGPITVLKVRFRPDDYRRSFVAELWLYPDGSRILELSTKCPPAEMFQVAAESRAFLSRRGIEVTGEQQTKTATALRYFSSHLGEKGS